MMGKKSEKMIIVELGNVDFTREDGDVMCDLELIAQFFPHHQFFAIDLEGHYSSVPNFLQLTCDFVSGLDYFDDGSVDLIISEMTLGFYNKRGEIVKDEKYTSLTTKKIYDKLNNKGRALISNTPFFSMHIYKKVIGTGFEDVHYRRFYDDEYGRTRWTRWSKQNGAYQIIAAKEGKLNGDEKTLNIENLLRLYCEGNFNSK